MRRTLFILALVLVGFTLVSPATAQAPTTEDRSCVAGIRNNFAWPGYKNP